MVHVRGNRSSRQYNGIGSKPDVISNDGSQLVPSRFYQPPSSHHPLLRPVVPEIGTNRSRAKIDIVSDDGIPGITQMRNKRPVPHNAILQLNALPHNTPVSQRNISPQIAIRTNPATVSHPYAAFHHHAGQHCGIPPKPQGSHNMRATSL